MESGAKLREVMRGKFSFMLAYPANGNGGRKPRNGAAYIFICGRIKRGLK